MRIIAGQAGGIPLKVPGTVARPTTDRVREALFASLGELIVDASVLDLYAGSGALGIEALSRGAASVTFVEQNRQASQVIEQNLKKARLADSATIRMGSVEGFLRNQARMGRQFGIAFADPPYRKKPGDTDVSGALLLSEDLATVMENAAWLLLETEHPAPEPDTPLWEVKDQRHYGNTGIWFLQKR